MTQVSLQSTLDFQTQLENTLHQREHGQRKHGQREHRHATDGSPVDSLGPLVDAARHKVRQTGMVFEAKRELAVALSPLVFDESDLQRLKMVSETLHGIVEQALTWVLSDRDRLIRFFPDHTRVFNYLVGTRGSPTWQNISRYDVVIASDGSIKIIELNTACPAGFFHSSGMAAITQELLREICPTLMRRLRWGGPIPRDALAQTLLSIERSAQLKPGLIALVNDENQLLNELALLQDQLQSMGRDACIVPADAIMFAANTATFESRPISVSFNKVRVSTADSPNHRWSRGFETRYAGFLHAMTEQAFASVNNVVALSIAEDKGLLSLLHHREFQSELTFDQQDFVREHVLPTARLVDADVEWEGKSQRIDSIARANPESFVIKPANEGRGFGLHVGVHSSDEQWQAACDLDANLPKVVQAYCEPARIPVTCLQDEQTTPHPMYLTLGLAMMRGQFAGVLSRISKNPVTNISQSGMVQAV